MWDYTLVSIALGSVALGMASGVMGSLAVLRRQALLGDTLAHATLPGMVIAFAATGQRSYPVLAMGAALAAGLAALLVAWLRSRTRLDSGTILGTILSLWFGAGVWGLAYVGRWPTANKAGLDKFLFGQAAALTMEQSTVMLVLSTLIVGVVTLFGKELKVFIFDPVYAATIGLTERRMGVLFTALLVLAILIGIPTVGVVLTSAMLVAPCLAARPFAHSLRALTWLAGAIGLTCGLLGTYLSATVPNLPTGPAIVLLLGVAVALAQIRVRRRVRLGPEAQLEPAAGGKP